MKNAYLDAVTKSKTAYVTAKTTLEARLREKMQEDLANMQTQIDLAVRFAYNAGESKASIMRALGTKDFHTVAASLSRTEGAHEIVGDDPLASVYSLEDDVLNVTYVNHGPSEVTGSASFDIKVLSDGSTMFATRDSLWNEDYTVKNNAVAVLDGKFDGYYYEEAKLWLTTTSAQ